MKNKYIFLALLTSVLFAPSCNDFLDKLPDDRASLDTYDKAKSILLSAYNTKSPAFLLEFSSDNVTVNGNDYGVVATFQEDVYRFQDVIDQSNDTPKYFWGSGYEAVATANEAISALKSLGCDTPEAKGIMAEALLCRAWGVFQLSGVFCMAWDPEKADEYLGLPYPKNPGETVPERGTLRELYENIDADIEEALPMLDDSHLSVPKYHFNTRAAYAFAARFNLFYLKYDKAIAYATKAIGSNPSALLRNTSSFPDFSNADNIGDAYARSDANLLNQTAYSLMGRVFRSTGYCRFTHNQEMAETETFWAPSIWCNDGGYKNNVLYEAWSCFGNAQVFYLPKLYEMFEYTDKVAGTGYAHIVDPVFTADETLLVRAEAEIMNKDYSVACTDMNYWLAAHSAPSKNSGLRPVLTEDMINAYWNAQNEVPANVTMKAQRGNKKPFHPQGFKIEEGTQTNMMYQLLYMRRIETWQQGLRFLDVKRLGIEYTHLLDGEDPILFTAGDLRGALLLPSDVIAAGLEQNPR